MRKTQNDLRPWPLLMSVRTAAVYLDVSTRLIERWQSMGLIKPVAMPGVARLTRFRRSDLDELAESLPQDAK